MNRPRPRPKRLEQNMARHPTSSRLEAGNHERCSGCSSASSSSCNQHRMSDYASFTQSYRPSKSANIDALNGYVLNLNSACSFLPSRFVLSILLARVCLNDGSQPYPPTLIEGSHPNSVARSNLLWAPGRGHGSCHKIPEKDNF